MQQLISARWFDIFFNNIKSSDYDLKLSTEWSLTNYTTAIGGMFQEQVLTHWGRVTHICVGNLTLIGSDNGLSPGRRHAIIWTNVDL